MHDIGALQVLLHGRPIGNLLRLPGDRVLFAFDDDYVADAGRAMLSLSFKDELGGLIADLGPTQTRLPPFFSNLLPEGRLREYLAARAGVKAEREFFLMAALGRDLPGALEIKPAGGSIPRHEDTAGFAGRTVDASDSDTALHFSLAGVQLKFSAVEDAAGGLTIPADGVGGSWIVKLPSAQFANVPENEFAMMQLARKVGISVPETALIAPHRILGLPRGIEVLGEHAYLIKRFDRAASGERIHIEDFAQVFSVYPERKYERASYRNIAQVLWTETGEAGITEFLRRLVFTVLIGNADMHLKNWSLIYPDRRHAELAPAYDFVATVAFLPDDRLALTFVDSKKFSSVTSAQFGRFAAKVGLPEKLTLDTVNDTLARFSEAWRNPGPVLIDDRTRDAIERHLTTLPLWTATNRV